MSEAIGVSDDAVVAVHLQWPDAREADARQALSSLEASGGIDGLCDNGEVVRRLRSNLLGDEAGSRQGSFHPCPSTSWQEATGGPTDRGGRMAER
mmetsp:Transcript_160482/g.510612  ORF Transcript_160482/g.510612 Transcript_160482/m.510612 type:complete len:95 (+) Transcript_160482:148-432(+)